MIKQLLYAAVPAILLFSCTGNGNYQKAEDAQDAGREFIRATLDGNYDKAKFYLLKNEDNLMLLDRWNAMYKSYSQDTIKEFKEASIRAISVESLNDSITKYTYSNSFTKDTMAIKIVRVGGEWLVDLKSFIGE